MSISPFQIQKLKAKDKKEAEAQEGENSGNDDEDFKPSRKRRTPTSKVSRYQSYMSEEIIKMAVIPNHLLYYT